MPRGTRLREPPLGGEQQQRAEQPAAVDDPLGLGDPGLPAGGHLARLAAAAEGVARQRARAVLPVGERLARVLELAVGPKVAGASAASMLRA